MIFLTLGTQLGFDRLVTAVDAAAKMLDEEVFGQVGASGVKPDHFETVDFMSQAAFSEKFDSARVVVAHAGMGSILSAMRARKPLVVMARRADLGEHRNDHQLATVNQMKVLAGLHVAETAEDIVAYLTAPELSAMSQDDSPGRDRLIVNLREEIFGTAA